MCAVEVFILADLLNFGADFATHDQNTLNLLPLEQYCTLCNEVLFTMVVGGGGGGA